MHAGNLKIISTNCRGLGDFHKRKDVFEYLRSRNASIFCLQDTHFTKNIEKIVRMQWGLEVISSYGTSDSRGVSILFNNNFEYKITEIIRDNYGNYIIPNILIEQKYSITLVNIYGPNQDNPDFYRDLRQKLTDIESDYSIICGDFNLVQNFELDCDQYLRHNNPRAVNEVNILKEELNLVDPWRVYNFEAKKYTWFRKNPTKKARLDFFLISESLLTIVDDVRIIPGYRSDHSIISLDIKISNFVNGKGFWKFNNSLLTDKIFVEKVKNVIRHTKYEYAIPIYNMANLDQIDEENITFSISDQLFFDTLLNNIRAMTLPYSAILKRRRIKVKKDLEAEISQTQDELHLSNDDHLSNKLEELKSELENIRKKELDGILLRSKCK